jgi:hypothetical protein
MWVTARQHEAPRSVYQRIIDVFWIVWQANVRRNHRTVCPELVGQVVKYLLCVLWGNLGGFAQGGPLFVLT